MHIPKVSIIVPVYNAAPYIRDCLDSIMSGNLKDIEVIAVNDGSSDNSLEILEEYRCKSGIVVIDQPNAGASKARNKALDVAIGEYVGFVDADDWVEPQMYSKMYTAAKDADADIVFCNIYRNSDLKMRKYLPPGVYDANRIRHDIYPLLISNLDETSGKVTIRGAAWPRIFRRDLLERNHIRFDERLVYNEDVMFCIEATLNANRYVYLGDDYLYHNRYVPGSLTKRFIPSLWIRQHRMIQKLKDMTVNIDYDFASQIDKKALEIAVYCIENLCKKDYDKTYVERHAEIRDIIKSSEIRNALHNIDSSRLKRTNLLYWHAFRLRSPFLSFLIARHRMKKNGSL